MDTKVDTTKQDHLIERAAARLRSPIIRPESPPGPIADEKPVLQGLTSRTKTRTQQSDLSARPPIALEKLAEAHLIDWGDAYSRAAEEFDEFQILRFRATSRRFPSNGRSGTDREGIRRFAYPRFARV